MRSCKVLYLFLPLLLLVLFVLDAAVGAQYVPIFATIKSYVSGGGTTSDVILFKYRIPRAIAAVLAGVSLSASGLQMQTLFRNPLADPCILGVSAGAGLGVALFLLGLPLLGAFAAMALGQALAAWLGAASVMLLLVLAAARIRDIMAILVLGVILGSAISAAISLLQYFGQAAALKSYVLWTMGSIGNLTTSQLFALGAATIFGAIIALFSCKTLDALILGEDYARTMGCNVSRQRIVLILTAALLTGTTTAFCGPIGFVGIAVPHAARMLCRTAMHRTLMPISMLMGACALLVCDILCHTPSFETPLPLNTLTALLGIPVVVLVIVRNQKTI